MEEWLAIYRDSASWSSSELTAEITRLKAQIQNPYASQTNGSRGYQRVSLFDLRQQMLAAQTALRERGSSSFDGHPVADFSDVQP
jgi:hypothetical protein